MGKKKAKKLTKMPESQKGHSSLLTGLTHVKFKLTISQKLDNNFCFKSLTSREQTRAFQRFVDETVGKGLTISKVDELFLRTKGDVKQNINGFEVIHYGKDRSSFRLFGYYNRDNYFVITRIDPNHKTHK